MPAEITSVWPSGQFLTVWSSRVWVDSGTSIGHLARADLARGDDPGAVERADRVDRQVDHRVERVAVEGQERAELEGDALLELSAFGW